MDVSPRTLTVDEQPATLDPGSRRTRRPRNVRAWLLAAVVLGALGFVVFRGLGNATLFFYNVDEAVARQSSLGTSRFRIQGSVVPDSVSRTGAGADFTITYNGVDARVHHEGDLPQLFQPNIPVVLEGRWHDGVFASDRVLVKHDATYTAANPDRVKSYGEGGEGGEGGDAVTTVPAAPAPAPTPTVAAAPSTPAAPGGNG